MRTWTILEQETCIEYKISLLTLLQSLKKSGVKARFISVWSFSLGDFPLPPARTS